MSGLSCLLDAHLRFLAKTMFLCNQSGRRQHAAAAQCRRTRAAGGQRRRVPVSAAAGAYQVRPGLGGAAQALGMTARGCMCAQFEPTWGSMVACMAPSPLPLDPAGGPTFSSTSLPVPQPGPGGAQAAHLARCDGSGRGRGRCVLYCWARLPLEELVLGGRATT